MGGPHRIDRDELFGRFDGHRLQEHGVDESEDRGVGADAERERDNDNESERRASYERPRRIAKVFEPQLGGGRCFVGTASAAAGGPLAQTLHEHVEHFAR